MSTPEIIGQNPQQASSILNPQNPQTNPENRKVEENPQIYSTIIQQKKTTIKRPIAAVQQSMNIFQQNPQQNKPKLLPGQYSVEVKINDVNSANENIPKGYVRPTFEISREKQNEMMIDSYSKMVYVSNTLKADFLALSQQIKALDGNNKEKALQKAINKIDEDIYSLKESIKKDKLELKDIKSLGDKMKKMISKYEKLYEGK